jgi:hypothetical protein
MEQLQLFPTASLGSFMTTWGGEKFYPSHPELVKVNIEDIAHSLSRNNRYNGCLDCDLYSVAQHSLIVADVAWDIFKRSRGDDKPRTFKLQALLHDATEYLMPDMPKPIKDTLPEFTRSENRLHTHIMQSFDLPTKIHPIIKRVDKLIRIAEVNCMSFGWNVEEFFGDAAQDEIIYYMGLRITPMSCWHTEDVFMETYEKISAS